MTTFRERADIEPPYRMLSLDGGGIRGVLSLEVLAAIESTLRTELGDDKLVLADWFDYIAGTSTGAIIASGLARGMAVAEISALYDTLGDKLFSKPLIPKRFWAKYRGEPVTEALKEAFGASTTFGDASLRTLLMVVLKNWSTDSPWPLSNNPRAKYNTGPSSNLGFPLWQIVRGSTAAPTFFPAEVMEIRKGSPSAKSQSYLFQDGGLTPYNNPAFQLFLMATLDQYKLGWKPGVDTMLLVSVGTGYNPKVSENLKLRKLHLIANAASLPPALMLSAQIQQDMLCRAFGRTLVGDPLDSEIDDLVPGGGVVSQKLFTYLRFNAELSHAGLGRLGLEGIDPKAVSKLDSVEHIPELRRIGREVATKVDGAHLRPFGGAR